MPWGFPGKPGFYFWGAKAATCSLLLVTLMLPEIGRSVLFVYLIALAVSASSLATLVSISGTAYSANAKVFGLILQAILLIVSFASLYMHFGLVSDAYPLGHCEDFATSLYFSIVTWTTLGYGDFVARPEIRLVAALEAIVGYAYFGIIVGLMAGRISAAQPQQWQPPRQKQD